MRRHWFLVLGVVLVFSPVACGDDATQQTGTVSATDVTSTGLCKVASDCASTGSYDPCMTNTCNPNTGICASTVSADGAACEDTVWNDLISVLVKRFT